MASLCFYKFITFQKTTVPVAQKEVIQVIHKLEELGIKPLPVHSRDLKGDTVAPVWDVSLTCTLFVCMYILLLYL